jgi:SRSO17 transposase
MNARQLEACAERLAEFLTTMLATVGRAERRHHGALYVQGLLLDGERKSIEPLAGRVPGGNVQALQQFVGQSPWAWEPGRRLWAPRMEAALLPAAAWLIDDTGFPKQGRHSVGVARQYSGTLGQVGNCQVAVTVHLSTEAESLPLDWALYLPQAWTADAARCRQAGVPEQTAFRTKPELALELFDHLLAWGLRRQPVLADAGYGNSTEFRQGLVRRGLQYLVGVESHTTVWDQPTQRVQPRRPTGRGRPRRPYYRGQPLAVRDLAAALPPQAWHTITWRQGTQGPQRSRFTACRVQPAHGHAHGQPELEPVWLLIEWPADVKAPTKYWFSNLPQGVSLRRLVQLAKLRWRVEQNYQQLKEELGLDHYEGRGWQGWHHHVTLVCLAYAFLLLERRRLKKNSSGDFAWSTAMFANGADSHVRRVPDLPPSGRQRSVTITQRSSTSAPIA